MTPEARAKAAASIAQAHQEGLYYKSRTKAVETRKRNGTLLHTSETKRKMSEKALASTHQRVCKSTHQYTDKHGRVFMFDSKWEDLVADRLDSLNIEWYRPAPIQYECNGKTRNYYPDFYLPAFELYLDPKNAYCERQQKEKLDIVKTKIQLLILRTAEECRMFRP